MACVDDWHIQSAPFIHTDAVADGLRRHGEHGRVVADEDDSASGRHGSLDHAHDVGNRQAGEERPHAEILEAGRRRRELVA